MGPLTGLKVVEFAGLGPAPFTGMLLADMGARVLVVGRALSSTESAPIRALDAGFEEISSRGKSAVAMDLRKPEAVQAALRIASAADVLIEGFRPGVMERLGLGPDPCLAANARLVYGRMTGWGQSGPLAGMPGHDLNYIALSGALSSGARGDGIPWCPPSLVGDMAGGLLLAFGIACAVHEARGSGRGQVIDAAMIDAAALLSQGLRSLRAAGRWRSEPGTNLLDSGAPFYEVYRCADDEWISLAALEPRFYAVLLDKLGLAGDECFTNQYDESKWPQAKRRLAEIIAGRTRQEWSALLEGTQACFAPVLSLDEAPSHPHNIARGTFIEDDGMVAPAAAPRLSRTPGRAGRRARARDPAQLSDWGFTLEEIEALERSGALERA